MSAEHLFDADRLEALQARLGVRFDQPELLRRALTHESYTNEKTTVLSYERLEFLGDAVLGLFVGELLYRELPESTEGELTRIRAALVSADGLGQVATDLDLGPLLLLGRGAQGEGVKGRVSVLSDSLEALLGAVYLDQGADVARRCVWQLFGGRIQEARLREPDPKTRLQLVTQGLDHERPVYHLVASKGPPHAPTFAVEVHFQGRVLGRGRGSNKKSAEQAAAREALATLEGGALRLDGSGGA